MENQLLELQISHKYGLINHMQSIRRGVILVPTNQYFSTKYVKKCMCHETVVFFPFSQVVVGWFGLVFWFWIFFSNLHSFHVSDEFRFIAFCKIPSLVIRSCYAPVVLL